MKTIPDLCRLTGLALLGVPGMALAASIAIVNPSFEDPPQADGGSLIKSIPGWTFSQGMDAGVLNPIDLWLSGTSEPRTGLPDGAQLAWMNWEGTVSQVLTAVLEPNLEYLLRVAVGDRKDTGVGRYAVELWAGGTLLGSASPATVEDQWVIAAVRYRALVGDAALGQPLKIVLRKAETIYGTEAIFDDVRLETRPISDPPESAALVAHWRFDESGGTVASEVTGLHPGQLTSTGAAFVEGGVAGNALSLTQVLNGMMIVPNIRELATNDFTVVFWVKTPPGDTTPSTYVMAQHEAWFANGFLVQLNTSGSSGAAGKATFITENGHALVSSTSDINDGQWHQVVLFYQKSGQTRIYVDGTPAEASRASVGMTDRAAPFIVGGLLGMEVTGICKGLFTGWVDDVQVYSRALSDAQIDLLYRNPGRDMADLYHPLVIVPDGGGFLGSVDVTLNTPLSGTTIRYTLDGTEPTAASPVYQQPITLTTTTTVQARLFVGTFPASDVASATFTALAPIGFEPPGGLFTNSVSVALVNRLGLGTLRYTTDRTDPVAGSAAYAGPVVLTVATTLKARVFLNNFPITEVESASYARVYALDDGIPAEWREQHFGPGYLTDPRVAPQADPDGDGWSNRLEYQMGSVPTDAESVPEIVVGIRAVPMVWWDSVPGLTYRVLRKDRVEAPEWEVIVPAFQATATRSQYVDADAPDTAVYQIELVR
ncbi:MAG TPA: chitobiase/beta-hexosaminidase C-terminal domain-containing protein [Verrucomicrobiota bacterium]|nr:chitobiase/beta-hexosaminidase C-terminal domain-containing protein [Verrucomicrobiota bacterium]HNU49277.1 chitobiase/beta-hexosaminidase C-terminal domain-containing protein [Verrucomicrobiota bacterium]